MATCPTCTTWWAQLRLLSQALLASQLESKRLSARLQLVSTENVKLEAKNNELRLMLQTDGVDEDNRAMEEMGPNDVVAESGPLVGQKKSRKRNTRRGRQSKRRRQAKNNVKVYTDFFGRTTAHQINHSTQKVDEVTSEETDITLAGLCRNYFEACKILSFYHIH